MIRIILNVPDDMLKELDQVAKEESRSRSEIIREAVREGIEARRKDKEFRERQDRAFKSMDEIRASTVGTGFSASEFVINWRNQGVR